MHRRGTSPIAVHKATNFKKKNTVYIYIEIALNVSTQQCTETIIASF